MLSKSRFFLVVMSKNAKIASRKNDEMEKKKQNESARREITFFFQFCHLCISLVKWTLKTTPFTFFSSLSHTVNIMAAYINQQVVQQARFVVRTSFFWHRICLMFFFIQISQVLESIVMAVRQTFNGEPAESLNVQSAPSTNAKDARDFRRAQMPETKIGLGSTEGDLVYMLRKYLEIVGLVFFVWLLGESISS